MLSHNEPIRAWTQIPGAELSVFFNVDGASHTAARACLASIKGIYGSLGQYIGQILDNIFGEAAKSLI